MKESYIQDFLTAGSLAGQVRAYGKSLICKGASYNDVILKIREKIALLGAIPAFPPQIALNDVAAHFLPQPGQDIIFSNEVVKLDVGICFNGAIGDCAVTVDLSGKHQHLIDAAEAALLAAESIIKVGLPVREIGKIIEETICSFGLQPVRNLCGHGLGFFKVHTAPLIPNYHDNSKAVIQPNMTFAIEPFATNGKGMIYEEGESTLFSLLSSRPTHSQPAQEVLSYIKGFKALPFCIHDLTQAGMSLMTAKLGLYELVQSNAVAAYPPLVEETHGMVAQAENSIFVDKKGKVTVTTRLS